MQTLPSQVDRALADSIPRCQSIASWDTELARADHLKGSVEVLPILFSQGCKADLLLSVLGPTPRGGQQGQGRKEVARPAPRGGRHGPY